MLSRIRKHPFFMTNNSPLSKEEDALLYWFHMLTLWLALPAMIFLGGYFKQPAFYLFFLAPLVFIKSQWPLLRSYHFPRPSVAGIGIGIAIVLLALSLSCVQSYLGIVAATNDTPKHILIFKELMGNPWPVSHQNCSGGYSICPNILRYALGFYLLPSLLATLVPYVSINIWIITINTCCYAMLLIVMYHYMRLEKIGGWAAFGVMVIFALFGDGDTLYSLINNGTIAWYRHNEGNFPYLEYSSNATFFRWVPQHAIPSIYAALCFLMAIKTRAFSMADFAFPTLIIIIWSPFAFMGILILGGIYWLYSGCGIIHQMRWKSELPLIIIAIAGIAVTSCYYAFETGAIPRKFTVSNDYMDFITINVFPIMGLGYLLRKQLADHVFLIPLFITLFLFPFVFIGKNNDFVMRVSGPIWMVIRFLLPIAFIKLPKGLGQHWLASVFMVICLIDGVSEYLYTGHSEWKPLIQAFDPDNKLPYEVRDDITYAVQYFAPCDHSLWFAPCHK